MQKMNSGTMSSRSLKGIPVGIVPLCGLALLQPCGCQVASPSRENARSGGPHIRTDLLKPIIINIPIVAWNSPFAGAAPPDALDKAQCEALLDTLLPRPLDVAPSESLISIIEQKTDRSIIWERAVGTTSGAKIDDVLKWPYCKSFTRPAERPTLRDGLGVLLGLSNTALVNDPSELHYNFRNYVLISSNYITVISLPFGPILPLEHVESRPTVGRGATSTSSGMAFGGAAGLANRDESVDAEGE